MTNYNHPTSGGIDDFVSVPDLAEKMGLSRQNVYDRINAGRLPAIELGPRAKIIRRDIALEHFRAERDEAAKRAERLTKGIDALEGRMAA